MLAPPFFDTNIRIGLKKFKMNWKRIHDIKIVSYPFENGVQLKNGEESIWG
jgi:hypothetical protein